MWVLRLAVPSLHPAREEGRIGSRRESSFRASTDEIYEPTDCISELKSRLQLGEVHGDTN
jgi:hypothetical protein